MRHQYEDLRMAYNAFIRLLVFEKDHAFTCKRCRDNVDIMIIDATCVGFNVNLMPPAPDIQLPVLRIPEYAGGDRVFVADNKARKIARFILWADKWCICKKSFCSGSSRL